LARFRAKATRASFLIAWIALLGSYLVVQLAGTLYIKLRFSKRQAEIAQRNCPACGSGQSVSVMSAAGNVSRSEMKESG
jgi:hypothetical protein